MARIVSFWGPISSGNMIRRASNKVNLGNLYKTHDE